MLHFWEVSPPLTSPQLLLVASMIYHSLCPEPSSTGQPILPSPRRRWALPHPCNPGSPRHPPTSILPTSESTGPCEPSPLCSQPPQSTLRFPPDPARFPATPHVTFLHCRVSILWFLGRVIFLFINLWRLSPHSEEKLKSLHVPLWLAPVILQLQ